MTEKEMQDRAMNALLLGLGARDGILRSRRLNAAGTLAAVDVEGGTTFSLRLEVLGSAPTPPERPAARRR